MILGEAFRYPAGRAYSVECRRRFPETPPMPVTARLSKLFYERFGEQITNELVDWFNAVDATYRADLRELNELNFARFDSKLEQRMSGLETKLEQRMSALETKLEQRMSGLETKLGQRMSALETKLEQRVSTIEFEKRMSAMDVKFADLRTELQRGFKEQTRFVFLAWASLLIPIIGLWLRG
jgi:protoporphyrinogen oxidase